jgi:hypothetical protein
MRNILSSAAALLLTSVCAHADAAELRGSAIPEATIWAHQFRAVAGGAKITDVLGMTPADLAALRAAAGKQAARDARCQAHWDEHAARYYTSSPDPMRPAAGLHDPKELAARRAIRAGCESETLEAGRAVLRELSVEGAAVMDRWAVAARAGMVVSQEGPDAVSCSDATRGNYLWQVSGRLETYSYVFTEQSPTPCTCNVLAVVVAAQQVPFPCEGQPGDGTGGCAWTAAPGRVVCEWRCSPAEPYVVAWTSGDHWLEWLAGGDPRCRHVTWRLGTTDSYALISP